MLSFRVYVELNPRPLASHLRLGPMSFPFSQPSNLEMRILDPGCICGTFQLASDVQTPSNLCAFARSLREESSHSGPFLPRQHRVPISPLAATLMESPASIANKRLATKLTPLAATLTKNRGVGYPHGSSPQLLWHSHSWVCSSTSYQSRPRRQW
jgi:hypothetical protein